MDADTAACKQSDAVFIVWMRHLDKHKTDELAARLAFHHLGREPVDAMHHSQGSFNRCYRVKFREGPDVLVRFPALGRSMFRQEKLEDEVAVMEYIIHNTSIPIPRVLGSGSSVVGPYMILEFVEGSCYLSISGLHKIRWYRLPWTWTSIPLHYGEPIVAWRKSCWSCIDVNFQQLVALFETIQEAG